MTARELAAAGVTDPALRAAYEHCRRLNARHGRTYFLATRLLTPHRRPAVHALYGFARWADDIVDNPGPAAPAPGRRRAGPRRAGRAEGGGGGDPAARLAELDARLRESLRGGRGGHPVLAALADTVSRYDLPHRHFTDFMRSMRMDLHVTDYPTFDELRGYMHGSAAVIGLQVLPVLGTVCPRDEAAPHAASLGLAFQLTNFLRDVGEDLDRDRIYLPADRLSAHGVDRELLRWCRRTGRTDRRVREALRELGNANRVIYRHAARGIPLLDPVSRPCVRTAYVLYQGILDEIESMGWAVMARRAVVPRRRRAAVAARGAAGVAAARLRAATAARPGRRSARTPARGRAGGKVPAA